MFEYMVNLSKSQWFTNFDKDYTLKSEYDKGVTVCQQK